MTQETEVKLTEADFVKKMESLYCEIAVLNEDIKQLKEDAKKSGYKQSKLAKIAKLRADCKVGDFISEVTDIIGTIQDNNL